MGKIYVSSTGDAFVDPAKDIHVSEETKFSESLFTKFTKKLAGIDQKITEKIVNKEGYDLYKRRKEIAEGYKQGKYFDKAHNLDIISGIVFKLAGIVGAEEEMVELLAPTIRDLIKSTNNPILKQFLSITTTGLLRAETAKEVALKEKLFKKADTVLEVIKATGTQSLKFIKTVADYIGQEVKQLSQNFVTSTDDFIANLLTNAGFLGPFVKMLWPYIEKAIGLIKDAIWGGFKFLMKGMFSPIKYLGQMIVSKIFAPKKETVKSVETSKALVKGFNAITGSLDLIKNVIGEEKVTSNKILNKVSKISSFIAKGHSLGETSQSPFTKLSNVFKGGYFEKRPQPAYAYATSSVGTIGGAFTTVPPKKQQKQQTTEKSSSIFSAIKNKITGLFSKNKQEETTVRKSPRSKFTASVGTIGGAFSAVKVAPQVATSKVAYKPEITSKQSYLNQILKNLDIKVSRLVKLIDINFKITRKDRKQYTSILSRIKDFQQKTVKKISSISSQSKSELFKSILVGIKNLAMFSAKKILDISKKVVLPAVSNVLSKFKKSDVYDKYFKQMSSTFKKMNSNLTTIKSRLKSKKEKYSEKIYEMRREKKELKIKERTNKLLEKLIKATKTNSIAQKVTTSKIWGLLKGIGGSILSLGGSLISSLFSGASSLLTLLLGGMGIKFLGKKLLSGIINFAKSIISKSFGLAKDAFKKVGPWLLSKMKGVLGLIATVGKGVLKKLGLLGIILTGIDLIKGPVKWIAGKIGDLIQAPKKIIKNITEFISTKIKGVIDKITHIFDPIKNFIVKKFKELREILSKIPVIGKYFKEKPKVETKPKPKTKTTIPKPKIEGEAKGASKVAKVVKGVSKTAVKVAEKGVAPAFLAYDMMSHGFNTKETFGVKNTEATDQQRLETMTGAIMENLSLGLLDRKEVAKNLDYTVNYIKGFFGESREDHIKKAPKTYIPASAYIYDYDPKTKKYTLGIRGTNIKFFKLGPNGIYQLDGKYFTESEISAIVNYYAKHKKTISTKKLRDIVKHSLLSFDAHFVSDYGSTYLYEVYPHNKPDINKRLLFVYDTKTNKYKIFGKEVSPAVLTKVISKYFVTGENPVKILKNVISSVKSRTKQQTQPTISKHPAKEEHKNVHTVKKPEIKPVTHVTKPKVESTSPEKIKSPLYSKVPKSIQETLLKKPIVDLQTNEMKQIAEIAETNKEDQNITKIINQLSRREKEIYSLSKKVLNDNNISTEEVQSTKKLRPIDLSTLPVNVPNITAMLIKHEGLYLHKYKDKFGYETIGIGHLLDKRRGGIPLKKIIGVDKDTITPGEALYIFAYDLKRIGTQLFNKFPWLKKKPEPVKESILDMAFQLGVGGISKFKKTLAAIKQDKYDVAVENLKKSLWYQQVTNRAKEIISRIASVITTIKKPGKIVAKTMLATSVATASPVATKVATITPKVQQVKKVEEKIPKGFFGVSKPKPHVVSPETKRLEKLAENSELKLNQVIAKPTETSSVVTKITETKPKPTTTSITHVAKNETKVVKPTTSISTTTSPVVTKITETKPTNVETTTHIVSNENKVTKPTIITKLPSIEPETVSTTRPTLPAPKPENNPVIKTETPTPIKMAENKVSPEIKVETKPTIKQKTASTTVPKAVIPPTISTLAKTESIKTDKEIKLSTHMFSVNKFTADNANFYLDSTINTNRRIVNHLAEISAIQHKEQEHRTIQNLVTNTNTGVNNVTSPHTVLTRNFDMREQVLVSRNNTYRKTNTTNQNNQVKETKVNNVPIMINQQQYINNVQQTAYNHALKFIHPSGKADNMKFHVEFS